MIAKVILIFFAGIIETYLFAGWTLTANQKKVWVSSILMFVYMTFYLMILDVAFKDVHSTLMLLTYAFACGIGNYIRIKQECRDKSYKWIKNKNLSEKNKKLIKKFKAIEKKLR